MNRVTLIGRTTDDIELKYTESKKKYIHFTVACDNGKNEAGEKREADFVNCVAWEGRAEALSQYVKKGHKICVEGSFKTDKYEKDGENRYRSYVLVKGFEFLESKKDGFVPIEPEEVKEEPKVEDDPFSGQVKMEEIEINSDDLPF